MIKKVLLFIVLAGIGFFAACTKEQTEDDYSKQDADTIKAYIAKKGYTAQSLLSGLYYTILTPGDNNHPKVTDQISVNYKGFRTDGFVFEANTYGNPSSFYLQGRVKGWQEGLPLIGIGGKIRLYIPSALGYGSRGLYNNGGIPVVYPNTPIFFDIELIDIFPQN